MRVHSQHGLPKWGCCQRAARHQCRVGREQWPRPAPRRTLTQPPSGCDCWVRQQHSELCFVGFEMWTRQRMPTQPPSRGNCWLLQTQPHMTVTVPMYTRFHTHIRTWLAWASRHWAVLLVQLLCYFPDRFACCRDLCIEIAWLRIWLYPLQKRTLTAGAMRRWHCSQI